MMPRQQPIARLRRDREVELLQEDDRSGGGVGGTGFQAPFIGPHSVGNSQLPEGLQNPFRLRRDGTQILIGGQRQEASVSGAVRTSGPNMITSIDTPELFHSFQ